MDLPPVPLWLVKSPPWHMNWGMTRWKQLPLKPKPFSCVHKQRKFSTKGRREKNGWKTLENTCFIKDTQIHLYKAINLYIAYLYINIHFRRPGVKQVNGMLFQWNHEVIGIEWRKWCGHLLSLERCRPAGGSEACPLVCFQSLCPCRPGDLPGPFWLVVHPINKKMNNK